MTCSYLNLSFALALWLKYRSRQIATTTITGNITIEHIIGMITVCGGTVTKKIVSRTFQRTVNEMFFTF